ncbi:MAG: hypothetical protein ABUM51_06670 [Bacteroidota bacterium]
MKSKSAAPDAIHFIIRELEELLEKGNAHAPFEKAVKGVDQKLLGVVPPGSVYSIW